MSLHSVWAAIVARSATYTKAQQQCLGRALERCVAAKRAELDATTQVIETLRAIADARQYHVLWRAVRWSPHATMTSVYALGNVEAARLVQHRFPHARVIISVTEMPT